MSLANRLIRGAVSGFIATLPMTATIYAGKALGTFFRPPPREVTRNATRRAHVAQYLSGGVFQLSWLAAHFGFGTSAGAAYGLVEPCLPRWPWLSGLAFGSAVWALFYTKILPDLRLYPPPERDQPSRTMTMISAHFVFGVVTAVLYGLVP